jgi:hypothetical protein
MEAAGEGCSLFISIGLLPGSDNPTIFEGELRIGEALQVFPIEHK